MAAMQVDGHAEPRFESVRETFVEIVGTQAGTGAALAVWHGGRLVVDVWGGYRDAERTKSWEIDNVVMTYSVTKPFAAVCALLLVDRGLLELDAPVNRYWPRFESTADVRQVLSHQAGIVVLDDPAETGLFYDWPAMCARLEKQPSSWVPGTAIGESALFYGHLVGELVRRVDGRSLGAFLHDEVCAPLGLEFAIGLDARQRARAVELTGLEATLAEPESRPPVYQRAMTNPPGARDAQVVNSEVFRAAEIPAINGHGTARGVAGLYAALLGGQLLSPRLLAEATTAQATGIDLVMGGPERSWGLGFSVDDDGFGMGGTGGSVGWASVVGDYAFGFVTGSMGNHDRADQLENAFRSCLGLAPI
jgi:CubicO group peptidase (beta-lactamase class C family)